MPAYEIHGPDARGYYGVGRYINDRWVTETAWLSKELAETRLGVLNRGESMPTVADRLAALEKSVAAVVTRLEVLEEIEAKRAVPKIIPLYATPIATPIPPVTCKGA